MTEPSLEATQFDKCLEDFVNFVGFEKIEKGLGRVDRKLNALPQSLRNLYRDKYFLHEALQKFLSEPSALFDTRVRNSVRAASFMQAFLFAKDVIGNNDSDRLRGMFYDGLNPDSDLRNLEAEMICCVHLLNKGWSVRFPDLSGEARYDFLASRATEEVEFECKNLSLDTTNRIKPDLFVDIVQNSLMKLSRFFNLSSGLVIIRFLKPPHLIKNAGKIAFNLLNLEEKRCDSEMCVEFHRRELWDNAAEWTKEQMIAVFKTDPLSEDHPSYLTKTPKGPIVAILVRPDKQTDIPRKISETIRSAANQFTTTRPSVVWLHLNGIPSKEFGAVAQQSRDHKNTALSAIAARALSRDGIFVKRHVNAVRFTSSDDTLNARDMLGKHGEGRVAVSLNGALFDAKPHGTLYEIQSPY